MESFCYLYKNKISTKLLKNKCRYHKKNQQNFKNNFLAKGLCFDAFSTAYPYCLSILYDAKLGNLCESDNDSVILKCPNPFKYIVFKIVCDESRILAWFKKKCINFLHKFGIGIEIPIKKIKIVVLKNVDCPRKYKKNDEFVFNISNKEELCPASFSAVYPFLNISRSDIPTCIEFDRDRPLVHCLDPRGVVYSLQ